MKKFQEVKMNYILEESKKTMLQNGIDSVTFESLSKEIGIGEATLYRYFPKKEILVVQVAGLLWEEIEKKYFLGYDSYKNMKGSEKIEGFLSLFLKLYQNEKEFLTFISDFDNFIVRKNVSMEQTNLLDEKLLHIKEIFEHFYQEGIEDGTLREIDIDKFYFSSTHSLMNLCIKGSKRGIVKEDSLISSEDEILFLIVVFMDYILK